jgi:DoxX-like family
MQSAALTTRATRTTSWLSRGLSAIVILFLIFDGVIHVAKPTPVVDAFAALGYPLRVSVSLGIIELMCVALYAAPRTSAFGALLLTAYLGGATATQVRVEAGWFPTIFPSLLGTMLWAGLALRNTRVLDLFFPQDA